MEPGNAPAPYTESGWLPVGDDICLHYALNDGGSRGAVLVAPGWTENTDKYAELADDFVERGYSVFVLDHRGQGLSSRLTRNPHVTHIERFEDYVTDLRTFYHDVVLPRARGEVVLLGHSLGGLISVFFAAMYPDRLRALVLSAPLFQVNGGLLPEPVVHGLARALVLLGRGERYVPGHRDWSEDRWVFEDNVLTRSQERFFRWRDILAGSPERRVGGVSNTWLQTIIEATRAVVPLAPALDLPMLLLQAGQDRLVRPRRQQRFCERAPGCRLQRYPDARHELLMEEDGTRGRVLDAIFEFLEDEAAPVTPLHASTR